MVFAQYSANQHYMRHNPLFDRLFGQDGFHPFGNPFTFEEYLAETFEGYENLSEEKLVVDKGEFRTTIQIKFNSKGFPVSYQMDSTLLPTSRSFIELKEALQEAIKREDYSKASEIQKILKSLEDS